MRAGLTPDYFNLIGMALIDGRQFRSTDDDKAAKVAIVNEAFAQRFFPKKQCSRAKNLVPGDRDKPGIEIVGEIANGRTDDLTQESISGGLSSAVAGPGFFETPRRPEQPPIRAPSS